MVDRSLPRSRVAVAQIGATLGDLAGNTKAVTGTISDAAGAGIDLVVFPECILSGYLYDSMEEVSANAVELDGSLLQDVADAHRGTGVHSVIGFLERRGDEIFNSAALFGPQGMIGVYRKRHLPFLGADRFVSAGRDGGAPVFDTPIGRIGIMICFDLRFPEAARELALAGSDIIAMPTNWAGVSSILPDIVVRVRALENLVYLAVANRPDSESGERFVGRSQIITPCGVALVDAGGDAGLRTADVPLAEARDKRIIIEPGVFELPIFEGRRPELYEVISATTRSTEGV